MTTYAVLKSDVADWLLRDDLVNVIPSFVRLAEANIRRDVRIRAMETSATITLTDGAGSLPSDFLQARRITLDTDSGYALTFMAPAVMYGSDIYTESGTAIAYTIEGDSIIVRPSNSESVLINYLAAFAALSDETDTNWLLANAYDIYLYATLLQAAPYIKDDQRMVVWKAMYDQAVGKINRADNVGRFSGAALKSIGYAPV